VYWLPVNTFSLYYITKKYTFLYTKKSYTFISIVKLMAFKFTYL